VSYNLYKYGGLWLPMIETLFNYDGVC